MQEALSALAGKIAASRKVIAFTGSGISAESGIPTFRGEGGLWDKYRPSLYGNIPGIFFVYLSRPFRLRQFGLEVISTFMQAEPNPAHRVLAELESLGHVRSVITQNIDDLHERAGSRRVVKLHGDLYRHRCMKCHTQRSVSNDDLQDILDTLQGVKPTRINLVRSFRNLLPPCSQCGGRMRPDVVFFGESLPQDDLALAMGEARICEVMLVVGTSGVVYPAASIPLIARQSGAVIAEFSCDPTGLTEICDYHFRGPASETLQNLLNLLPRD